MTRPVAQAPRAVVPPSAVEMPVRHPRLETGRGFRAPAPFEPTFPPRFAPGPTLSRVMAGGDAWRAYQGALLRLICDALESDCASLLDDLTMETAAVLALRSAAPSHSLIASAEARQGLTVAITTGAAS